MSRVGFSHLFDRFSYKVSYAAGSWQAFLLALSIIVIWLLAGLHYGYSEELYQMTINSATTVITFLMVFLIQASQNRDTIAIHMKLDELIRAIPQARDEMRKIEALSVNELNALPNE